MSPLATGAGSAFPPCRPPQPSGRAEGAVGLLERYTSGGPHAAGTPAQRLVLCSPDRPPHQFPTLGREDSNPMRGPMSDFVRRALSWGIVLVLLLPILLSVVSGLAALLAALGDEGGARLCWRVALLAAVIWLLAVVATSVLAGLAALAAERGGRRCDPPSRHRRRHDGRRPGRRRGDRGWPAPRGGSSGDGSGDDRPPPRHEPRPG